MMGMMMVIRNDDEYLFSLLTWRGEKVKTNERKKKRKEKKYKCRYEESMRYCILQTNKHITTTVD